MCIMDDLIEQVNDSENEYDFVKEMSESEKEELFHILFFEELESWHSTDFFCAIIVLMNSKKNIKVLI